MSVFQDVKKEDLNNLDEHGFYTVPVKATYETVRLQSKSVSLILFHSGKLLVQGRPEMVLDSVELLKKLGIGKLVKVAFKEEQGIVIGSDEALKGDTFGGIVVAAVKADYKKREELMSLGVADSKSLVDEEIIAIAEMLEKVADFYVKNLSPEEYNAYPGNVTGLLNKLHSECYYYLKPGKHIVDKYPGCNVGDVAETKAESKYVEVAAASIIARAHALRQLNELSAEAGFTVPKGSTHVQDALEEVKKKGLDAKKFVKLNFKNVKKVLTG
jgi:ribonuclease HIII